MIARFWNRLCAKLLPKATDHHSTDWHADGEGIGRDDGERRS